MSGIELAMLALIIIVFSSFIGVLSWAMVYVKLGERTKKVGREIGHAAAHALHPEHQDHAPGRHRHAA